MKRVQFTKFDLSPKAYEWYQGCSCEIAEENGIYYMDDDKMGSFEDLQEAFEIYQNEFENNEIQNLIDEIKNYEISNDITRKEFENYDQLGGMFYTDTNLLTKEIQYCWTDDEWTMREMYENSDKKLGFDFFINKVSYQALESFLEEILKKEA